MKRVKKEINESLLFKFNDRSINSFEKFKSESVDMATILEWLEKCSILKKNKSESKEENGFCESFKELNNPNFNNSENNEELKISGNLTEENLMLISDKLISQIEEPTFNIFELEKEVGENNILSTISCYAFSTMGFYSFINYVKLENFVYEITKGYYRKNPYHNVFLFF